MAITVAALAAAVYYLYTTYIAPSVSAATVTSTLETTTLSNEKSTTAASTVSAATGGVAAVPAAGATNIYTEWVNGVDETLQSTYDPSSGWSAGKVIGAVAGNATEQPDIQSAAWFAGLAS